MNRPLRIGVVLVSFGIGGTEKRLARLFQYLVRHSSHRYYLAAPDRVIRLLQQQGILKDGDLELYRIDAGALQPMLERLRWPFYTGFPGWRRALDRALEAAQAAGPTDAFHYAIPISYFMARREFREHAVVEAQAATHEWHLEFQVRVAARRGAVVNCLSLPILQTLERRLSAQAASRLHLSPGSLLDMTDAPAVPKEPHIAFVGRLEAIKNPLLFVDAIARLAARRHGFTASILGEGRLQTQVNARIQELGLGRVMECSFHHAPIEVLSRSAVFVSLQSTENYPSQALLEAMACRCAIVASDVGSTVRLVTPDTGLLVPLDADAIAASIESLLCDPARAHSMGVAAHALVRRDHSIERYAQYVETLYRMATEPREQPNVQNPSAVAPHA